MTRVRLGLVLLGAALGLPLAASTASAATLRVLAWNNLGMHCMDDDFSIFSLLPPYNTIGAQVVRDGVLVKDPIGLELTYRAIPDPTGSVNTTSAGKTNFWTHALALYGASLPVDGGLAGNDMPGAANTPRALPYDASLDAWVAEGVPITPYDDAGRKNPYPMMRVEVRDAGTQAVLGHVDTVLPVSDEMQCRTCHLSRARAAARPAAGWVDDPDPTRDYRLNILRLHDGKTAADPLYASTLAARGYLAAGLFETASAGTPVLCAGCHASNALPGTGEAGVTPLTQAIHSRHARIYDARVGSTLDASDNRAACYTCHPGSATRCLRGEMGNAIAADGSLAIQCQSCHGAMHDVGAPGRVGWLDEPACQNCHTGTAMNNSGQLRYTSVFDAPGHRRDAVDTTFSTTPNVPVAPFSLYRFSSGHGGLQCEACHDSTHAESPSSHRNDNIKANAIQGHVGMISECSACHAGGVPAIGLGGPHGLHPVGAVWVEQHGDFAESSGTVACRSCHGSDLRGTVLSRALGARTLSTKFGTKTFWRGFQVSCFSCHDGPNGESPSPNHPAVVANANVTTAPGAPLAIPLAATDADGDPLVLRVVSQPKHGTVAVAGTTATYFPEDGYVGNAIFTFAANDGTTDSNLGRVTVGVGTFGACGLGAELVLVLGVIRGLASRVRRR